MPVPSLAKTWQHNVNNAIAAQGAAIADNRILYRSIKNALIGFASNPWTMRYSCNSVTAGTAGDGVDRLTTDANFVWATDGTAAHSWCVLRQAGISAAAEICLSWGTPSATGNAMTVVFSPSAGFTGGTTTTRPSATDELVIANNLAFGPASDLSIRWSVSQSSDGQCTRILVCWSGSLQVVLIVDKVTNATTGWATPSVAFIALANASPALLVNGAFKHGSLTGVMAMAIEPIAVTTVVNDISSEWPMVPIGLNSSTVGARGRHGTVQDLWWGSGSIAAGDVYPDATAQFVQFGNLIFPWNGGAVNFT